MYEDQTSTSNLRMFYSSPTGYVFRKCLIIYPLSFIPDSLNSLSDLQKGKNSPEELFLHFLVYLKT